jgi:predicted hotdog family 3-hydroxylacyl-ACP dehydratase
VNLNREAIARLIPHRGEMCLLETVESWDATAIVCTTTQHASASNPLRRNGRLSSVHAIEFAAQATAVHGALNMPLQSQPRFGLLVSVRHCAFFCVALDDARGRLRIEARRSAGAESLAMYDFVVSADGGHLAEGRLSVYLEPTTIR